RSTVPYFEDVAPYLRGSYWQHPWSSVDDRHSLRAHTAINVEPYLLPSFATRLIGELSSEVYLIASRRKSGSTSEQGHTIDHMMELAQMNPGSQTIINRRGSSLGFLIPALINHREIPQYIQERVELQMQALLISAGSNSEVLLNERDLDGRDLTEAGLLGLLRAINSTITAVDPQHLADDLSRAAHNARVAYYSARFKPRHLSAWEANFTTSMYMPIERLTRHHSAFQGTNMDFRAMIARHVEKVTVRCEGSMPIGSCGIASLQRQQQDGTFGLWVIPFSIQTDPNDPNTRRQLPEWMSHQFAKTADAATTYGLTVHAVQALEYALPTTTAQLFTLYSQHGNFSMTGDKLLGSASNGFRYSETQAWHSFPIAAVQREIGLLQ
ncbi:hypothetical protein MRY87_01490, partial [bacterium]|nr:hypothetical protein [bacterium]